MMMQCTLVFDSEFMSLTEITTYYNLDYRGYKPLHTM
jgi:hypothetical protein